MGHDVLTRPAGQVAQRADPLGLDPATPQQPVTLLIRLEDINGSRRTPTQPGHQPPLTAVEPVRSPPAGEEEAPSGGGHALEQRLGPGTGANHLAGMPVAPVSYTHLTLPT